LRFSRTIVPGYFSGGGGASGFGGV